MQQKDSSTYRLPAEWEPHEAIWLAWPHDIISFPNLPNVQEAIATMIKAISASERVELLVTDKAMEARTKKKLQQIGVDLEKVTFHLTTYMNAWMRDCGPLFVKNQQQQLIMTQWIFNAWGEKFPDLLVDGKIPEEMEQWLDIPLEKTDLVLEGGAIDVNGQGVCLTTEQCLLNPNRNPGKNKAQIEAYLKHYLGIHKTIWLQKGLFNDHTDGHIDEIARFVDANTIVYAYEDNPDDENFAVLNANYSTLKAATNLDNKPFTLIRLPMPHCSYDKDKPFAASEKAPISYTNFYIGNSVVLAPIFNDPNDQIALEILQSVFPHRKVVAIDCSEIMYGGGTIHCLTQQQPIA